MSTMKKNSFKGNEDTRIWCEYCRIFVYNNRINRDKHDTSPQHQANFKKKVETLRREEEQKKRSLPSQPVSDSLSKSFYQKTKPLASSSSKTDAPANILSIKCLKKPVEAKIVLGLATSSIIHVPITIEADSSVEYSETRAATLDIKSTASELKRKMNVDENSLMEPTDKPEPVNEDASVEVLSLFKKKKSK